MAVEFLQSPAFIPVGNQHVMIQKSEASTTMCRRERSLIGISCSRRLVEVESQPDAALLNN